MSCCISKGFGLSGSCGVDAELLEELVDRFESMEAVRKASLSVAWVSALGFVGIISERAGMYSGLLFAVEAGPETARCCEIAGVALGVLEILDFVSSP